MWAQVVFLCDVDAMLHLMSIHIHLKPCAGSSQGDEQEEEGPHCEHLLCGGCHRKPWPSQLQCSKGQFRVCYALSSQLQASMQSTCLSGKHNKHIM